MTDHEIARQIFPDRWMDEARIAINVRGDLISMAVRAMRRAREDRHGSDVTAVTHAFCVKSHPHQCLQECGADVLGWSDPEKKPS